MDLLADDSKGVLGKRGGFHYIGNALSPFL